MSSDKRQVTGSFAGIFGAAFESKLVVSLNKYFHYYTCTKKIISLRWWQHDGSLYTRERGFVTGSSTVYREGVSRMEILLPFDNVKCRPSTTLARREQTREN